MRAMSNVESAALRPAMAASFARTFLNTQWRTRVRYTPPPRVCVSGLPLTSNRTIDLLRALRISNLVAASCSRRLRPPPPSSTASALGLMVAESRSALLGGGDCSRGRKHAHRVGSAANAVKLAVRMLQMCEKFWFFIPFVCGRLALFCRALFLNGREMNA